MSASRPVITGACTGRRRLRNEISATGKRIAVSFEPVQVTRLRLRLDNRHRVWSEEQGGEIVPPLRLDEVIIR